MGSTTVHIPEDTLRRIDRIAQRRGISRNKVVLEALEETIARDRGEWPQSFFEAPYGADEARELAEATRELETAIRNSRRNRGAPLL